jgi:hypothetical protein
MEKTVRLDIWKTLDSFNFHNCIQCTEVLISNDYRVSEWIIDIVRQPYFSSDPINYPVNLGRVSVSSLGFEKQTTLEQIYNNMISEGLELVPPEVAINCRFYYDEQPLGEWLRFATPMDAMIDSDGVQHLPKLGKALGLYFIETYWSYKDAVFHPHNEFVVVIP